MYTNYLVGCQAACSAFVDQHGLGDQYLAGYVKRVMAITPQEVQRITGQYLVPEKMTLVVVGDAKTVKDQLAPWSKMR